MRIITADDMQWSIHRTLIYTKIMKIDHGNNDTSGQYCQCELLVCHIIFAVLMCWDHEMRKLCYTHMLYPMKQIDKILFKCEDRCFNVGVLYFGGQCAYKVMLLSNWLALEGTETIKLLHSYNSLTTWLAQPITRVLQLLLCQK